jgi:hypothetical protein
MTHAPGRIARIIRLGLAGTIGVIVLLLLPDLLRLFGEAIIPPRLRAWWVEAAAIALLATPAIARRFIGDEPGMGRVSKLIRGMPARIDFVMDRAWAGGLAMTLGLVCAGFLIAWIPHYLTWPFSRDEDTFAVLALSWDRGILPYRDIRAYNFPGETYLFWGLGKVFGWGRTVPFYAFDASCVVLLGCILVAWSRRRLGGAVPGLVGYLAFLGFYLSLAFENTGEREWHTAFLAGSGLMVAQAFPGRGARIASALMTALAFSIRPHAVLFLPALAAAVAEPGSTSEHPRCARLRAVLEWSLWLGLFVAVAFAPVIAAGIAGDWIRGLRVPAYGGPYSKATPIGALRAFLDQLRDWRTDVPLAATLLLATSPGGRLGSTARTWSLAWLGVLAYRPLHPVQHTYLIHPVLLFRSITWALAVSWLVSRHWLAPPVRVVAVALLAYELVPEPPWMCSLGASARAVRDLARGAMPAQAPLGCLQPFQSGNESPSHWGVYCATLAYLRRATGPQTFVANVLNRYPYESLNGPTGRLSPLRAESGICWLSWVDIDLDPEFARDLLNAPDSVVVWEPRQDQVDPAMRLERVVAVIREYYEPEARVGRVEVWRRKAIGRPGASMENHGASGSRRVSHGHAAPGGRGASEAIRSPARSVTTGKGRQPP